MRPGHPSPTIRSTTASDPARESTIDPTIGRVRAVHEQARRGLTVSVAFVFVAAVGLAVPAIGGWWSPLHLFAVGGLLGAISAVTPMLAVTWSAAPAPRTSVVTTQRWTLAAGAVALAVGREQDLASLTLLGGTAVTVSIAAMIPILWGIRRTATTPRFRPAIDAYLLAFTAGVAGSAVGLLLASGNAGRHWAELRSVHLTLNVLGLVGLVIAGTLPWFAATQLRARMPARARASRIRIATWTLAVATGGAVVGHLRGDPILVTTALVVYVAALTSIVAMLPMITAKRWRWAGPRVAQLGAGIAWWIAMVLLLAVAAANGNDDRRVLLTLVIGGYAQILVASLAYLGPVLRGGGHRALSAGFGITRSWTSLAAGNAAALGALLEARPVLAVALVIWGSDAVWRAVRLAASHVPAPTDRPLTTGSDHR